MIQLLFISEFKNKRAKKYRIISDWLRIASEVYHQSNAAKTCLVSNCSTVNKSLSKPRKQNNKLKMSMFIISSDPNESFAIPNTNLEFASLCLRNALALVEHIENDFKLGTGKLESTTKLQQNSERTQCNPSKALTQHTFQKLKYAVLAAYSYVQITLGEYLLALEQAQELLKMPDLPDPYA